MKILVLSSICAIALVFSAGCGRREEEPPAPAPRLPEPDYEEVIEADELPGAYSPYEMPDIETDEEPDAFFEEDDIPGPPEEFPEPDEITDYDEPEEVPVEAEPSADPRGELGEMGIEYHKWAFIEAAGEGNLEAVKLFVEAGMDVDAVNSPRYGETALIWAARGGHADVVRFLIASGAEVNKRNTKDMTALGYALMFKRREAAEALREAGGKR